jgi:hypothetical protein
MIEFIAIFLVISLWLFLSFIGWYLHHVVVVKNNPLEDDISFLLCIVVLPIIWVMILFSLFERLDFSDLEDKIRARLDRFFGI